MAIRAVGAFDVDWVRERLAERWGGPEVVVPGRLFRADLLPGFVAEDESRVLGLVTYRIEGERCQVITLDSSAPGRGVGTGLLAAVREAACAAGCGFVGVATTNDNLHALGFYQRRGFRVVAVRAGSLAEARRLKPGIPAVGLGGIPLRDEIELEWDLGAPEEETASAAWVVYMLRCADGSLYTGIATDLARRLAEHNRGDGARYTRSRLPVEFVYAETAEDRSSASVREAVLKKLSRAAKLRLVRG